MKVISRPHCPLEWSKNYICRECDAILTIEEGDLYARNTAMAYAGETWDPRLFFDCVVCRTRNDVTSKMAHGIQKELFRQLSEKYDARRKAK